MPSKAFQYHETGDFIFCRDKGWMSRALQLAQRRIDREAAPYSHAAMCIHPGLFIHSVPGGGVQLLRLEDEHPDAIGFGEECRGDVLVLRLKKWPLDALALVQAMLFWTGQSYNFSFLKPIEGISGKAYCSQLLLQIIDRAGLVVPGRQVGRPITPSSLFRHIRAMPGKEVTEKYHDYARLLNEDPQERYLLANDLPREMIFRAAARNLAQAKARQTLTAKIVTSGAIAAEGIADVAAALRSIRGCSRPVQQVARDIESYFAGVNLLFDLVDTARLNPMHHLDLVGTPAVVVSGMVLYPPQLQSLSDELQLITDEFAALFDVLELMNRGRSLPAARVAEFLAYCERRLEERPTAAMGPLAACLHKYPVDLDTVVLRERALEPVVLVIRQIGRRIEALSNMETALQMFVTSSRQLWGDYDRDRRDIVEQYAV